MDGRGMGGAWFGHSWNLFNLFMLVREKPIKSHPLWWGKNPVQYPVKWVTSTSTCVFLLYTFPPIIMVLLRMGVSPIKVMFQKKRHVPLNHDDGRKMYRSFQTVLPHENWTARPWRLPIQKGTNCLIPNFRGYVSFGEIHQFFTEPWILAGLG